MSVSKTPSIRVFPSGASLPNKDINEIAEIHARCIYKALEENELDTKDITAILGKMIKSLRTS